MNDISHNSGSRQCIQRKHTIGGGATSLNTPSVLRLDLTDGCLLRVLLGHDACDIAKYDGIERMQFQMIRIHQNTDTEVRFS